MTTSSRRIRIGRGGTNETCGQNSSASLGHGCGARKVAAQVGKRVGGTLWEFGNSFSRKGCGASGLKVRGVS